METNGGKYTMNYYADIWITLLFGGLIITLLVIIGVFALIGFGKVCWLFWEWLFNSIGE